MGLIPGSGRSPEGGHSHPLQHSCLKHPMVRGAWWATVHRITKSQTRLKRLNKQACTIPSLCTPQFLPSFTHQWRSGGFLLLSIVNNTARNKARGGGAQGLCLWFKNLGAVTKDRWIYFWAPQAALLVKNLPANAGDIRDAGAIPGSGRASGEGHGNPPQHSRLENPMDRGTWQATVHGVTKSQTRLKRLSIRTLSTYIKIKNILHAEKILSWAKLDDKLGKMFAIHIRGKGLTSLQKNLQKLITESQTTQRKADNHMNRQFRKERKGRKGSPDLPKHTQGV